MCIYISSKSDNLCIHSNVDATFSCPSALWPLHDIVITNIVWCMALTGGGR